MVCLKDVITQRGSINEIAAQLGFKNLRILIFADNTLNLLVAINREHPAANADNAILLESKLIKLFQCRTAIIVESRLKFLEKEKIIKNAISIDDIDKLEKLIREDPLQVSFKPIHLSRFDNIQLNRQNKLADEIINRFNHAIFFKNNMQKIDDKMSTLTMDEVSNEEKVLAKQTFD